MTADDFKWMIYEIDLELAWDPLTKLIIDNLEQVDMQIPFVRKRHILDEIEGLCDKWLTEHSHKFPFSAKVKFLEFEKSIKERRSSMGGLSKSRSNSSLLSSEQKAEIHQYHQNNWKVLREGFMPLFKGISTGSRRIVDIHKYVGENLRGVQYLSEKERAVLEVTVARDGLFRYQSGALFDTSEMETSDAGRGWAAFVVSERHRLYAHSHFSGQFHHSSFFGGAPVRGAGEISIVQGRLVAISCKSGHYQPDEHMLFFFLIWLQKRGVNLYHIPIRLSVQEPIVYYDAHRLIENKGRSDGLAPIVGPVV